MQYDSILIGVDEIWTKSEKVRKKLMLKLAEDIEKRINTKVRIGRGRIFIDEFKEEWLNVLNKIFGIKLYFPALKIETNLDNIKKYSEIFFENFNGSFKIQTKRVWKGFEKTSIEVNKIVGEHIVKKFGLKVDLKNPDKMLYIEIHKDYTYLYDKIFYGPGGFPLGTQGKGLILFSGGIDSPVAAYLMGKRGIDLDFLFINIAGPSYEKLVYRVFNKIKEYFPESKLYIAELDPDILFKVKEGYRQIMFKVIIYKIAEKFAKEKNYDIIITGESLGQVSTQTLKSLIVLDKIIEIPVFRPLIGFNKDEIIEIARKIGTYDLQVPEICELEKHPVTKPNIDIVKEEWEKLNLDIETIVKNIREARDIEVEIEFPKDKDLIVVDVKDVDRIEFDKNKKYLIICPTGFLAEGITKSLRKKGIIAYSLDYKTAKRLGYI